MAFYLLYLAAVGGPAIVAGSIADRKLLTDFSMTGAADFAALIAIAVLSMQFVLSARLKWIERPFGLDRIMLFHRMMALAAAALLLMHPLLLAADPQREDGWKLLYTVSLADDGWKVLVGMATLVLLLTTAIISLFRLSLRFEYQQWLRLHNILALCIIAGGLLHGLLIGPHIMHHASMEVLWILYPAVAMSALIYNRGIRPAVLKARARLVCGVKHETGSVVTLFMAAPGNRPADDYLPGQFHFLTLYRKNETHPEQHPFTISSSPADRGKISFSIKKSGDYTATIDKTAIGDRAALLGPFGRFSYRLHPFEKNLVFIAGGIGITPLMSMVRYMRDTGDARDVLLLYGNRKETDIVFRKELDEIAEKGVPRLRICHVLAQADGAWTGERGRISGELIKKECATLDGRVFYLCGPPIMMTGLVKNLGKAGVKRRNIRFERFSI